MTKLEKLLEKIEEKSGLHIFNKDRHCLNGKYLKIFYSEDLFEVCFKSNNLILRFNTISSVIDFILNNVPDDNVSKWTIKKSGMFPIMNI